MLNHAVEVRPGADEDLTRGWESTRDYRPTQPRSVKTALQPDDLAGRLLLLVSVGIVSAQVARRSPVHSVADATPVAAV